MNCLYNIPESYQFYDFHKEHFSFKALFKLIGSDFFKIDFIAFIFSSISYNCAKRVTKERKIQLLLFSYVEKKF